MKKKIIILVVLAAAIAGGVYGYRTWQRDQAAANGTEFTLYGNVDIRKVDLGFRVAGRLATLFFEEGDAVRQGEQMALLDRVPYENEVALAQAARDRADAELTRLLNGTRPQEIRQARAQVSEAEASLKALEEQFQRNRALVKVNAISRQAFDDIQAGRDAARARLASSRAALALALEGFRKEDIAAGRSQLAEAEARLEQARIRLGDTAIIAPADGVLLTRVVEQGAIVAAGQTVATLSLNNPVWIRAYVPEPQLGKIWPGMPARIYTDSRPGHPYRGHVGFISPEAEFTPKNVETPRLRTDLVFRLRVVTENPDEGLRQGMPVTVELETQNPPPERGQGGTSG